METSVVEQLNKLAKKAKRIRNIAIFTLLLEIVVIGLSIGVILQSIDNDDGEFSPLMITLFVFLAITCLFILINFIDTLIIMLTDWKISELQNSKIVWGVIGLLLLGNIANIAFGSSAYKKLKTYSEQYKNLASQKTNFDELNRMKLKEYNEFLEWKKQKDKSELEF